MLANHLEDIESFNNIYAECCDFVREDIESILPPSATYKDLCKLAISYSDGVIQSSKDVDPELLEYAREKGIPVLEYDSSDAYAEACNNFYDTIYSQEK